MRFNTALSVSEGRVKAVSYTHLDVYKRQRHICAAGHGDGNGIGAVVHRTGHAVDGEAGDALSLIHI